MTKITENVIETFCIELLEKQGYEYIYAPDIAPDSDNPQRNSFEDIGQVTYNQRLDRVNATYRLFFSCVNSTPPLRTAR
jgi:hypothetical protein